jgi:hypothetical protein
MLALVCLVLFGMVNYTSAQLEPEAFTILKVALIADPPDLAIAAQVLTKYQSAADSRSLQLTWLELLAKKATGDVTAKRNKMAALFDAFDDALAPGENVKKSARTFLVLRDELLPRNTAEMATERFASAFANALRGLPDGDRRVLMQFSKSAKGRINDVVK